MKKYLVLIFLLVFSVNGFAITKEIYHQRGDTAGNSDHWTIVDWLKQKNTMQLWNQWLQVNSSSPLLDVSASAAAQRYKLKTTLGSVSSTQNQNSETYN